MRRLLQIGTYLFLLVICITPLSELCDRWDPPGLANDAEFSVFALAFALCLVLILMRLVSVAALRINLAMQQLRHEHQSTSQPACEHREFLLLPVSPPPLRI
jgi:hypothetical protein